MCLTLFVFHSNPLSHFYFPLYRDFHRGGSSFDARALPLYKHMRHCKAEGRSNLFHSDILSIS